MFDAAVLTAIFGGYDTLKPTLPQYGHGDDSVDWVLVTDDVSIRSGTLGWRVVHLPRPGVHPNRAAKQPKLFPWEFTPAPASVWIDASFRVTSPDFVREALDLAQPIAQFVHPWRDCALGDQKVRTVKHGDVRIDELTPGTHRLVSYDTLRRRLVIGHNGHGYGFERAVREYTGDLVSMTTNETQTRVTPNHWVAARWTTDASQAFCVYLMRRGDWWRIGKSQLHHGEARRFGPASRVRGEGAEELWLLGVYATEGEALLAEEFFSAAYGITQAIFRTVGPSNKWSCHVTNEMRKDLHNRLSERGSGERARQLLGDLGLDVTQPIWTRGMNNFPGLGASAAFKIRAGNLVSGWMEVPVAEGLQLGWRRVTTTRESAVSVPVYSLDVERHHAYVGDGQVLYNCLYTEAEESAKLSKYAGEDFGPQVKEYRRLRHPENWGLWATGVIARQHDDVHVRNASDYWGEMIDLWTFQDQVSQPVALRFYGLRPAPLTGTHFANPWLTYEGSERH